MKTLRPTPILLLKFIPVLFLKFILPAILAWLLTCITYMTVSNNWDIKLKDMSNIPDPLGGIPISIALTIAAIAALIEVIVVHRKKKKLLAETGEIMKFNMSRRLVILIIIFTICTFSLLLISTLLEQFHSY